MVITAESIVILSIAEISKNVKESVTAYCFAINGGKQLFSRSILFQAVICHVPFEKQLLETETFQIQ
jgi:hypothetical protein